MKIDTNMDKKYIYVVDSDILSKKISQHIYSILCVCGSEAHIQQLTTSINKAFSNLDVETSEGIASWIANDENLENFIECLTAKDSMPELRLSCLVSNHSYAMMVRYIKAITGGLNINNPEIARVIESIYPEFERMCIPLLLKEINTNITEEIFLELNKCLSLSQELKGKKALMKLFLPIQMQHVIVKNLCDKVFPNLSMSDYIQYVNILEKMTSDCQQFDIYASFHCNISLRKSITAKSIVEKSKPMAVDINSIQHFDNKNISLLFAKLIAINDFAWNRLHLEGSLDALTNNEKYLILSLWILFMGNFSSWMLSNMEYKKLSSIFEELRNK